MQLLLLAVAVIVLCFGFVLLFGAPYLPTLAPQIDTALAMLDLKPGQTLIELGCGDGRVMIAAAKRGINVVGYELNPLLFGLCWLRTRRYRQRVRLYCRDFWRADWPPADAVFGFILPRLMHRLDAKIVGEKRGPLHVVSFAFAIPGKQPVKSDKGVFLYRYEQLLSEQG